ncbi:MAG: DedA family protein [Firmicutes bacterium]|nr:DedA family protein [Bacillota bacterium]
MAAESAAIPLPSEVILPFGGYLVASGHLTLLGALLAALAGGMAGGFVLYLVGLYGGRPVLERYGRYILIRPEHMAAADRFFARYGAASVLVGRLLPGVRTYISLPAGIARMRAAPFLLYSFLGSLPWTLALLLAGRALGAHWRELEHSMTRLYAVLAAALAVAVVLWLVARRRR